MNNKEILDFIASSAFQDLVRCDTMKISQFNAFTLLLITKNIPFDVEYNPITRRDEELLSVTIYIAPTVTLTYNFKGLAKDN